MEKSTIRFRYGICLNDYCEKAKVKEVQEIPSRKEFVCQACGKPLRECPPPKKRGKTINIVMIAILSVIVLGGGCFAGIKAIKYFKEKNMLLVPVPKGQYQLAWGDYKGPLDAEVGVPDGDGGRVLVTKDSVLTIGDKQFEVIPQDTVINCVFEKGEIKAGEVRFVPRVEPGPEPIENQEDLAEPEDPYAFWTGEWVDGQPHGQGTLTYAKHFLIDPRMKGVYAEKGDYVTGEFEKGYLVAGTLHRTDGRVQQFNNGKLPAGSPARK